MNGLSIVEADSLFGTRGGVDEWIELLRRTLPFYKSAFAVEKAVGRRTALARFLGNNLLSDRGDCLVYITQTGILPSFEHVDLFDNYRSGLGETRCLEDAPLQRYSSEETDHMISILCLILYFSWDAEIASLDGRWLLTISHDNWIEIRTSDLSLSEKCDSVSKGILIPLGAA